MRKGGHAWRGCRHDVANPHNALAVQHHKMRMSSGDVGRVISNGLADRNGLDNGQESPFEEDQIDAFHERR